MSILYMGIFVYLHLVSVEVQCVAPRHCNPMFNAVLCDIQLTQMVLTYHGGRVAIFIEDFWKGIKLLNSIPIIRPVIHQSVIQPGVDAVLAWHTACPNRRSRG